MTLNDIVFACPYWTRNMDLDCHWSYSQMRTDTIAPAHQNRKQSNRSVSVIRSEHVCVCWSWQTRGKIAPLTWLAKTQDPINTLDTTSTFDPFHASAKVVYCLIHGAGLGVCTDRKLRSGKDNRWSSPVYFHGGGWCALPHGTNKLFL